MRPYHMENPVMATSGVDRRMLSTMLKREV
jgi:hypothetical protein